MAPSRKWVSALAAAAVAAAFYAASSQAPVVSDRQYGFSGGLNWEKVNAGGLDRALNLSREDGKPVVIYFWAVWCQYCKKLDTEVFPSPEVKPLLEGKFHRAFVDLDEDRRNASRFGVLYPPTLLFMNSSGSVLFRLNGFIEKGDLQTLLQEVLAGAASGAREGNQTHAEHGKPPSPRPGNLSLPASPVVSR